MDVKKYLNRKGIKFREFRHPPVYTCEEAERYTQSIRGVHSKNLFLKDRKSKRFYLVIIPAEKKLDMSNLSDILDDKVKFANDDDLKTILGLETGAVSPFGLINDENDKAILVISEDVWDSDFVSFHPNVNTETLELSKEEFHKYVESISNQLKIIKL